MAKGRGSDSEDDLDEELFQLTEKKSNKRNKSLESSDEDYEEVNKVAKKKKTTGPGRKKGSTVQNSSNSTINYGGNRRNRGAPIENDEGFDDGYDDELYRDDDDRNELFQLPEFERENILSERYEKRIKAKEIWRQQKEKEKKGGVTNNAASSAATASKPQSSTRGRGEKEEKKSEALKDIQRKREKSIGTKKDKEDGETTSSTNNTPTIVSANSTPKTQSTRLELERQQAQAQQLQEKEREKEKEHRDRERDIEKEIQTLVETIDINLMNQCRLSRNMLVKWVDQPYFENYAPGFFVRVVIGSHLNNPIYRIAEIVEVVTGSRVYKVENKETDKLLLLSYAGSKKEFGIENVSNNTITTSEHEKWISDMVRAKQKLPSPQMMNDKIGDIKKAQDYIYTNEDIEKRAQERIKLQKTPINIAIEKAKLFAYRETLEPTSEEFIKVCEKIEKLNEMTSTLKEENVTKVDQLIANINKKNKSLNFKYQSTSTNETVQINEFDPFARRKTRNCAVVAVDTSSLVTNSPSVLDSTSSPINAALSPNSQQQLTINGTSSPIIQSSKNNDTSSSRSLYDIHRSIDLGIFIPDQPNKVLAQHPKKKRQIIPANQIKNDHSMFKNILTFQEYLSKMNRTAVDN